MTLLADMDRMTCFTWGWDGQRASVLQQGPRARACPNIESSSFLRAGLEAPAMETKAGLQPDE